MPPTGNVDDVQIGPGILYAAPLGTTEPASPTATPDAAWREIGWTEEGSVFTYEITNEDVLVAEEFDPVKTATTTRKGKIAWQMAQASRKNLALALNVGAAEVNDGTTFEPPDPGQELRVMLLWRSDDTAALARQWLFRRCLQTGTIEIGRKKAPNKALLPVEFKLEKPSGAKVFKVWPSATGQI